MPEQANARIEIELTLESSGTNENAPTCDNCSSSGNACGGGDSVSSASCGGRGASVYAAEIIAPLVKEAAPVCHVFRALMPAFIPIHFGRAWARTGSARLWTAPEANGWKPAAHSASELQRFPHPFP
jgi:hypothetical protein